MAEMHGDLESKRGGSLGGYFESIRGLSSRVLSRGLDIHAGQCSNTYLWPSKRMVSVLGMYSRNGHLIHVIYTQLNMPGDAEAIKSKLADTIIHCWILLDPSIFD